MAIKESTIDDGRAIILEPVGSLIGGDETEELKQRISSMLEKGITRLIVDLAGVNYLNSSAIGVLTVAHAAFTKRNGKMILCHVNKGISNIFLVTKLSTIFHSEETREEAIFALGS